MERKLMMKVETISTCGDEDPASKAIDKCSQMHTLLSKETLAFRKKIAGGTMSQLCEEVLAGMQKSKEELEEIVVGATSTESAKPKLFAAAKWFKAAHTAVVIYGDGETE